MKIKPVFVSLLLMLVFASCGTEFRLAKDFVAQSPQIQVAAYFPEAAEVAFVVDDKGDYSHVLDSVDQNLFLDIMYASYAEGLRGYQMNVYVPDDPDAVQTDSLHWLVILTKVELQGLYTDYVDHLFDFVDEYDYSFVLNTVNVASWFDVNDGEWHPTQYDEFNLRDDFRSWVTNSRQEGTQYHYEINPLKASDVYDYAVFLGKRYAALTFNHMMNCFIEQRMAAQNRYSGFKLRWNPVEEKLYYQLDGEGFIELKADDSL